MATQKEKVWDLIDTLEEINEKNMDALFQLNEEFHAAQSSKELATLSMSMAHAATAINDIGTLICALKGVIHTQDDSTPASLMN